MQFTQAADAANRAVMADTDDASAAAADEARRARQIVEHDVAGAAGPFCSRSATRTTCATSRAFKTRFDEYRRLDDEILPLAVENTNLKAQRLSFGPAQEAAERSGRRSTAALRSSGAEGRVRSAKLAGASAQIAVLEIQVLQAPHIAEAEDAAMTRMEEQMAASAAVARKALDELKAGTATSRCAAACRGHRRTRSLQCDQQRAHRALPPQQQRALARTVARPKAQGHGGMRRSAQALEEALAKHEFTATR